MTTKYKIYILSYNDTTHQIASKQFESFFWSNIINIKTTPILENIMYHEWLQNNIDDWITQDYVGTLSWRSNDKININKLNIEVFCDSDYLQKQNYPDVFAFYPIKTKLIYQAKKCHGEKYMYVWTYLLQKLGYKEDQILDNNIGLFASNYWMAKPSVMMDYINFFTKAYNILLNEKNLQEYLWSNSDYKGYASKRKLLKIFGVPYYPLFPFLLERLPCFFFQIEKKYNVALFEQNY